MIDKARRSGEALVPTLNSILEYTGATQEHLAPKAGPVSLSQSIRDVVERYRKPATDRGLDLVLRLDLARSEDVVLCDGRMLDGALSRLLDNAVKFTKAGSIRVNVELKRRGVAPYPAADVEVTIADTGIGIPGDCVEAAFAPFFQVDSESTRAVGGTGLASRSRGASATPWQDRSPSKAGPASGRPFSFAFPRDLPNRRAGSANVPASGRRSSCWKQGAVGIGPARRRQRVQRCPRDRVAEHHGPDVTHALDGELARRLASDRAFDVVLMDCQMPNVDGYESTRRIRADESRAGSARVPIVALTANALSGDRERCMNAGMDDYLAKPYSASELNAKLAAWLPVNLAVDVGAREVWPSERRQRVSPAS